MESRRCTGAETPEEAFSHRGLALSLDDDHGDDCDDHDDVHDDDHDKDKKLIFTRGDEKAARGIPLQAARSLVVSLEIQKVSLKIQKVRLEIQKVSLEIQKVSLKSWKNSKKKSCEKT